MSENAKFALDVALEKLQGFLRIDRIPAGIEIKKGSQWFSIPDGLACDVVNHSEEIMRMCRYSNCADEVFYKLRLEFSMEGESFPFGSCILSGQWRDPCGSSIGKRVDHTLGPSEITRSFLLQNDVREEIRYRCGRAYYFQARNGAHEIGFPASGES